MAYNIVTKNGMAFNLDDPFQDKLYKHMCSVPNASGYLKRLIGEDLMRIEGRLTRHAEPDYVEEDTVEFNDDMMLKMI